jgi:ribosomal protein S18 acetylase RimI-like enzyme
VEVRRLGVGDHELGANAIRLLKSPDGYPTPSGEDMATFLNCEANVLIVASEDGVPVGYLVAYLIDRIDRNRKMMFFYEIGVAEAHRRRGIGKQMIAELKAICRQKDVLKMWVPTSRSNVAATRLYASTGGLPISSDDEVTYTYPRESFIVP